MHLNKYLAHAGICSRRKAVELIKEGKIRVNNTIVAEPGYQVRTDDIVRVGEKMVRLQENFYVLLNKPKGYITTVADERGRKTVMHLLGDAANNSRLYPVGRLDRDTTGFLLLTNDGELAQKLSHPRYEVKKMYHVTLSRVFDSASIERVKEGLMLEDGKIEVDHVSYVPENPRSRVRIQLHSGKNRIVRRIFEHLGYEVLKLDRVNYAGLSLKGVARGAWRYLTKKEIQQLNKTL